MIAPLVLGAIVGGSAALGGMRNAKSSNKHRNLEFMKKTTPYGGESGPGANMINQWIDTYSALTKPENLAWTLGNFNSSRNMLGKLGNEYYGMPGGSFDNPWTLGLLDILSNDAQRGQSYQMRDRKRPERGVR